MKKFVYLFLCLLFTLTVNAQFVRNDEGRIIPYSMSAKYKNVINTSTVNACLLKSYNNDSLYIAYNKQDSKREAKIMGNTKISGISIDTLINLKSAASRYKIDEGTVWIYRIESKTAKGLAITINSLVIPQGAYISIFPKKEELETMDTKIYFKKDIVGSSFFKYIHGNQLYIEYFEPNNIDKKASINISRIGYIFL